jgi:hypothetical protein
MTNRQSARMREMLGRFAHPDGNRDFILVGSHLRETFAMMGGDPTVMESAAQRVIAAARAILRNTEKIRHDPDGPEAQTHCGACGTASLDSAPALCEICGHAVRTEEFEVICVACAPKCVMCGCVMCDDGLCGDATGCRVCRPEPVRWGWKVHPVGGAIVASTGWPHSRPDDARDAASAYLAEHGLSGAGAIYLSKRQGTVTTEGLPRDFRDDWPGDSLDGYPHRFLVRKNPDGGYIIHDQHGGTAFSQPDPEVIPDLDTMRAYIHAMDEDDVREDFFGSGNPL